MDTSQGACLWKPVEAMVWALAHSVLFESSPAMSTTSLEDTVPQPEAPSFLVGSCRCCQRLVLTVQRLEGDHLVDACLHCDTVLDRQELDWVGAKAVGELGYDIDGEEAESCDSHGGCGDKDCGVRQPAD